MMVGKVKWFNDSKGYGIIEARDGIEAFCHYTQIQGSGFKTLKPGDVVSFELYEGSTKDSYVAKKVVKG